VKTRLASGTLVLIALAIATAFAIDRYLAMTSAQELVNARVEMLSEAQQLAARQSGIFSPGAAKVQTTSLKTLVQDVNARHGLTVTYMNENERDIGDKIRERTVLTRSINVPHEKLIAVLAELESRSGGARMKEIRVKPSSDRTNLYDEVETVLALRSLTPAKGAPGVNP
jgi:hypothetical protein